jgi:hypothetical protein
MHWQGNTGYTKFEKTHMHLPYVCIFLQAHLTVQILIDVSVSGIVHYGTAGNCNDSLLFGDVSVPKLVAFTGARTRKVPLQIRISFFDAPQDVMLQLHM